MTKLKDVIATIWYKTTNIVRPVVYPLQLWRRNIRYWRSYGFFPPPEGTDFVGYETLIENFNKKRLGDISGDVVEIGAFCGGGTYKLSKFLLRKRSDKKVYVIDIFDISFDTTQNTTGLDMATIYQNHLMKHLGGKSQKEIFQRVTKGLDNIVILPEDSKKLVFPADSICFAFIDGSHVPGYIINDFYLVWNRLSPGGIVALHDYGWDLPEATETIDQLCTENKVNISDIYVDNEKHIIFIQKKYLDVPHR